MFTLNNGSGFALELDNGWTVSVQWGSGNYGSNRHKKPEFTYSLFSRLVAKTAELAAWNSTTNWKFPDGSEVLAYCWTEQVLEFATALQELPFRKSMEVWEAQYFGTENKHPDGADHVASAIGLEPDTYRNDRG